MEKPFPVNLMTQDEVRALRWGAEARDKDGHLISMMVSGVSDATLGEWVRECRDDELTITIWPPKKKAARRAA